MKVLVIGGGGREHALCWKISQSPLLEKLYCLPGNPGIAEVAQCVSGDALQVAQQLRADLVVVGPEAPLAAGLVDRLHAAGIAAFGPTAAGARLEASKFFCKDLLRRHGIPTGGFAAFASAAEARAHVLAQPAGPLVVKANGLAAGKGVVVAPDRDAALAAIDEVAALGAPGGPAHEPAILVEECLCGEEVSLIALTDGTHVVPLAAAQDHKRIGEGDTGPNTGGMGCYSPVPAFSAELLATARTTILEPTLRALAAEGVEYRGALYAGLMLTAAGPQVIEFNCRFGDPETQVILPRLQSDLLPLLLACSGRGALDQLPCEFVSSPAACVVMSAQGYPAADYRRGDGISGLEAARSRGAQVFQAGTARQGQQLVTAGGRVLGVSALGDDLAGALRHCYRAVEEIHFEGAYYRRDIGQRCLN